MSNSARTRELTQRLNVIAGVSSALEAPTLPNIAASTDALELCVDLVAGAFGEGILRAGLQRAVRELLRNGKLEKQLKEIVRTLLVTNQRNVPLPPDFTTSGYAMPLKFLDPFDIFRLDPTTPTGQLGNKTVFGRLVSNTILRATTPVHPPQIPGTSWSYSMAADIVNIQGTVFGATVGSFFDQILDNPNYRILDPNGIAEEVMEILFQFWQNRRTARGQRAQQGLNRMVTEMNRTEETDEAKRLTAEQINELLRPSEEVVEEGLLISLGCRPERILITAEEIITRALQPDLVSETMVVVTEQLQSSGVVPGAPVGHHVGRNLIKALVMAILRQTFFAPQVWSLILLSEAFRVGYPAATWASTGGAILVQDVDMGAVLTGGRQEALRTILQAIRQAVLELLLEFLLKETTKRLQPLLLRIGQERLENYQSVLSSLTGAVSALRASGLNI